MKKTLKVMHLVLSLNVGGAERIVANIVQNDEEGRFEHEVCCLDDIGVFGEALCAKGHTVHLLKRGKGVDWFLIWRLFRLLRQRNIDILHTHGETPWFYGALACSLPALKRSRCITTVHGYGGGDRVELKGYRLWKVLTLLSRKVVLVANNFEAELRDNAFDPNKLVTILNGVAEGDSPSGTTLGEGSMKACSQEFVVGIVARLSPIKNHELLIRAVGEIKKKGDSLKLIIVGGGPQEEILRQLVAQEGLTEVIHFAGEHPDPSTFFGQFDVFVLPSLSEGISMTILEAMSRGVPVIASAVGGNLEIIDHERNGLLFPSGDLKGLVGSLRRLIEHPSERNRLAEQASNTVQDRFGFKTMLGNYHNLYTAVAARR